MTTASADAADAASELLRFERMLVELSAQFVTLPHNGVRAAIDHALRAVGEALDLDRSVLFRFDAPNDVLVSEHSWTRPEFPAARRGDLTQHFPWATARVRRGERLVFSAVDELPPEAAIDAASYRRNGCKSHVAVPLAVGGRIVGALAFATFRSSRAWSADLLGRLNLVAEILGNALAREEAQETLETLHAFERMASDVVASLVLAAPASVDEAIAGALGRVARTMAADRATLWETTSATDDLRATHAWHAPHASALPAIDGDAMRRLAARLEREEPVRSGDVRGIATDADGGASDAALLVVPLRVERAFVGALSLERTRAAHAWPDALVSRVQLMGDVLATVVARRRSEQRALEAQAEAAQHRERLAHLVRVHTAGEMSAGIAHEINQPLVAIENYALAARRYLGAGAGADPAKLTELVDKILAQSSRAGDVIKHLRAMVRRHEFEVKRIDMRRVVADSLRFVTLEGQLRDVALAVSLPEQGLDVTVDEVQIQQVILNLARNAIESMARMPAAAPRRLDVAAGALPDQRVFVRVADNGPGFDDAQGEHLFEPFYTTKDAGLGVGLSLCRTIVEAHGGHLRGSAGADGGAVFEFTLPCADEAVA